MMPLYGFLQGDTIGLLILADENETVQSLADKLHEAASVRVPKKLKWSLIHNERTLAPSMTLAQAHIEPLDRFDVVEQTS